MSGPGTTDPEMSGWRRRHGYALLRLRTDVTGASGIPVKRPGDLVLARWHDGTPPFARGWMLHGIDFECILTAPEVDVIEQPSERVGHHAVR
jgi:hypothetical protein